MSQTYKNIIFTNHAYDRIKLRSLALHSIFETVNNPEKTFKEKNESKKYVKTIRDRKYHVVAIYNKDQKKYVVISAWIRGEEDKQPLVWQLMTLPFKILFWVLKKVLKIISR